MSQSNEKSIHKVALKQRFIHNPVKHLRWSFLWKYYCLELLLYSLKRETNQVTEKIIWDKVFKSGLCKFCEDSLEKFEGIITVCLSRPYLFKNFKGCLPQNLLSLLLYTLSHMGLMHNPSLLKDIMANFCFPWNHQKTCGKIYFELEATRL